MVFFIFADGFNIEMMKRLLVALVLMICGLSAMAQVEVKINVANYAQSPVILGYYYNNQMLVKDTVVTDDKGVALLKKDKNYDQGIYLIFFPKNQCYFDVIMGDDQTYELSCDTLPGASKRVKVSGCAMMEEFIGYQQYLGKRQEEYKALSEEFKSHEGDSVAQNRVRDRYKEIDQQVKEKNDRIIEANKGNCLALFLDGLRDIEIPDFEVEAATEAERDSLVRQKKYYYYREHYFDNLPLSDNRVLRTPYFVTKLDKYFTEVIPQIPDTVSEECIKIIGKASGDDETYRYIVSHLYNMMNQSKVMGMDAALVAIADNYYLAGKCPWADQKFIDDLREQVSNIRYTLIGHKAVDLKKMPSVNQGEYFTLSEVDAPFTLLVFWEPSCGHCKKEIPQLKTEVWDKYASKGIKIFAVYCQSEYEPWKEFIEENQLEEWMNVYDPYRRTNFRTYYNIKSTPQIYILDKDKTIVAKRIGVDQIGGFLDFMMGNN